MAPLLPMKPHLSMSARTDKPFEPVYTDADAQFYSDRHYDVSQLEPVVAKPHSPDNRASS